MAQETWEAKGSKKHVDCDPPLRLDSAERLSQTRTQRLCVTDPPLLCWGFRQDLSLVHQEMNWKGRAISQVLQYLRLGSFCGRLRLDVLLSSLEGPPPSRALCSVDFYSKNHLSTE